MRTIIPHKLTEHTGDCKGFAVMECARCGEDKRGEYWDYYHVLAHTWRYHSRMHYRGEICEDCFKEINKH